MAKITIETDDRTVSVEDFGDSNLLSIVELCEGAILACGFNPVGKLGFVSNTQEPPPMDEGREDQLSLPI
jgi:hypothetical protein